MPKTTRNNEHEHHYGSRNPGAKALKFLTVMVSTVLWVMAAGGSAIAADESDASQPNLELLARWSLNHGSYLLDVGKYLEALEAFERDPDAFDLVLTDLVMPGHDGLEVLAEAKRRDAGRPVVLVTAHGTMNVAEAKRRDQPRTDEKMRDGVDECQASSSGQ